MSSQDDKPVNQLYLVITEIGIIINKITNKVSGSWIFCKTAELAVKLSLKARLVCKLVQTSSELEELKQINLLQR